MPTYNSTELAGDTNSPKSLRPRSGVRSRELRTIATFDLATRQIVIGDILNLGERPKGSRLVGHRITSSVSLGASTLAIGVAGNTGKYRAAATFTAVDTPTPVATAANVAAGELAADEKQIATIAAANLPAAGLLTIETFYTAD